MAEGLLRHLAGDRFEVHSAGLHPRPIHPLAVEVMRELGIDISGQRSKSMADVQSVGPVLVLIIVCANAEAGCPDTYRPVSVRLAWPFDDPSKASSGRATQVERFRRVRDEIRARIEKWLREELPREWLKRKDTAE